MDNSIQNFEEEKNKLYNDLLGATLGAIETNTLSFEEGQEVSIFVLANLEPISSKEALLSFLDELTKKWPVFNNACLSYKESASKIADQQEITQAREQLQEVIQ